MARTKSVLLRLSEEEYARLKQLAGREPMNAYLRRMAGVEEGEGIASESRPGETAIVAHEGPAPAKDSVSSTDAPSPPHYGKWFCSTCNTLSRIPRCAKDPQHKVTPA